MSLYKKVKARRTLRKIIYFTSIMFCETFLRHFSNDLNLKLGA